ncbi:MAG: phosphopentomutase [Verrucomicrobiales bacterium]
MKRALLLILDSVGCGHAPDAAAYGDAGSNTLGHILEQCPDLRLPTLDALGLREILRGAAGAAIENPPGAASVAWMRERAAGKDTTSGHWEIAGAVLDEPFATFEHFPADVVAAIEAEAKTRFIGNKPASGTAIIAELGDEHMKTGAPILYTSADSVMQIAAHEEVVPVEELYRICRVARGHCDRLRIGRVIARPFIGRPGHFTRTANRHDFSYPPPRTVLNALDEAGIPVAGVGKIRDIFDGSGIAESHPTKSNAEGMAAIEQLWAERREALIFANLVDFDQLYGHRRDVRGYAAALAEFDAWLAGFLPMIEAGDLVLITADHGNDPTWQGTDHTREQVPLWALGSAAQPPENFGLQDGFGFVARTIAAYFEVSGGGAKAGAR